MTLSSLLSESLDKVDTKPGIQIAYSKKTDSKFKIYFWYGMICLKKLDCELEECCQEIIFCFHLIVPEHCAVKGIRKLTST
jgi:hypothetical protein